MRFRTLVGILIVLIVCSCNQQTSKDEKQKKKGLIQHFSSKSGLLIEHRGYHGSEYTDSLGTNYRLKYNPITVTNDSTIPIHIKLAFSKEYDYPMAYGDEQFKVFPMPEEWVIKGGEITDSMWDELKDYWDKPILNKTVEPGEKIAIGVGTLYPMPNEQWSVVPNELFEINDRGIFPKCDWLIKDDQSLNPEVALGLKLIFTQSCIIIPCGQISYSEH